MLITEGARGDGGRLYYIDSKGNRVYFMEDMYGERGNLMPRDIVSNVSTMRPRSFTLILPSSGIKNTGKFKRGLRPLRGIFGSGRYQGEHPSSPISAFLYGWSCG